jgi:N-methylhydantoinase A
MGQYRLGVDVGGTHTDIVLADEDTGDLIIEKVPSTPNRPARAVISGLESLRARGIAPDQIDFFGHGTTVSTNALLELKGAKFGLLITRGFRAVQEVQNQARESNQFDLRFQRPPALVPQSLTREIGGRMSFRGEELEPLDEANVLDAVDFLAGRDVTSFAVCYLFSFANPAHEQRTADLIRSRCPEAFVSLSSEVLPRIREWPRLSTTLLDAYLAPVVASYARELSDGLDRAGLHTRRRFLMQSNGGVMPLTAAGEGTGVAHTLLSGPAAGVQGCAHLMGVGQGFESVVTLDMGGTSCDIAFIEGARPLEATQGKIAERDVHLPMLDVATISAGGGTIARVDAANKPVVGPDSAGADPGPACYGAGGTEPTVTDADLVCGYLNPDHFLGGRQRLDREASAVAIDRAIATPMGVTTADAALGIVRLVNGRMADEIRVGAAKKAVDLRGFTLVPFGGAGPVHAAMVAAELGIGRILVPPHPGAFSALGLLCSDVVHDYIRSALGALDDLTPDAAEANFAALEERAREEFTAEGFDGASVTFEREFDLRYAGQGYELRTALKGPGTNPISAEGLAGLRARFDDLHETYHGHAARSAQVETVSYRLRARVAVAKVDSVKHESCISSPPPPSSTRKAVFEGGIVVEAPVHERAALAPGHELPGPVIVEQFDTTTVVPPGWRVSVDLFANLLIEREG